MVTMVTKHLSIEIEEDDLLRLNLWCKLTKKTQEKVIAGLIRKHIPVFKVEPKVE